MPDQTGRAFEHEVADHIRDAIRGGRIPLIGAPHAEVFVQRAYPAEGQSNPIKFDVAVEVKYPGAREPSLRWVIECKDWRYCTDSFVAAAVGRGQHASRASV